MSFKIYSVESRKGGVGKTTIALNLAKTLLSRGPVLLLDCDITGTSISEPANKSVYWTDVTNVLMEDETTPKNLLGYYITDYIKGKADIESFMSDDSLMSTKINIIGSEIYGPTRKTIVDARLLMDELHSFWLMEFIDLLIQRFERRFAEKGKPLHIIIDNSPGFVGFCQSLHEYMLRLGPEKAKFVMVSSVDAQDLQSSFAASMELYEAIKGRLEMASYYQYLAEGGKPKVQEERILDKESELRDFFVKLTEDDEMLKNYMKNVVSAADYLSLILNKVPAYLKEDNIGYTYSDVIGNDERSLLLFREITSAHDDIPRTVIYYDDAISYQYYYRYLKTKETKAEDSKYDWTRRYKELSGQNEALAMGYDCIREVQEVEKLYKGLTTTLNNQGCHRILKTLQDTWEPTYGINLLKKATEKILTMAKTSVNRYPPYQRKLHEWNEQQVATIRERAGDTNDFHHFHALVNYVEEVADFDGDTIATETMVVASCFLNILMKIFLQNMGEMSLYNYCQQEFNKKPFPHNWMSYSNNAFHVDEHTSFVVKRLAPYFNRGFEDFYRSFCYSLLRNVDVHTDYNAILSAVRLYVPASSVLGFSKDMTDYLNNVIFKKTEQFEVDKLSAIKSSYFAMTAVQTIIRNFVIDK